MGDDSELDYMCCMWEALMYKYDGELSVWWCGICTSHVVGVASDYSTGPWAIKRTFNRHNVGPIRFFVCFSYISISFSVES